MSVQKQDEGGPVGWRKILHPFGRDDKGGLAEPMIRSDVNNEVKTRTPGNGAAFAFTVLDLYHLRALGVITTLAQVLNYNYKSGGFGDRHRINLIPVEGKSREEYTRISMAAVLGQIFQMEDFGANTMITEGQKKGK